LTMATITNVGQVIDPKEDIFPTTGAHLDVRVLKDGKYIDPSTIRSLLARLRVGKEQKPLWQQVNGEWKPSYTITSPYGKRTAPTKGASTFHLGKDFAIGAGTPLAWEGPGQYIPGRGYSTIKTTDPQGSPYEVRLLHTKPGQAANIPAQAASEPPPSQTPAQLPGGDTYIYVAGGPRQKESEDFLSSYIRNSLMEEQPSIKSAFNPTSMLMQAFSQTPNYMS
jgi:hypothetical protein